MYSGQEKHYYGLHSPGPGRYGDQTDFPGKEFKKISMKF